MSAEHSVVYKQYKCILFIAMIVAISLIASAIAVQRVIAIGPFIEPGGIFIFPLTYFISDAITEVYGYKISRQILWAGLACQFLFAFMMIFIMHLPSATFWHDQTAFKIVFNPLLFYCIAITAGTFLGGFANIYLLSKWKIFLMGRFFWLRSLGSTAIGEAVFSIVTLGSVFALKMPLHDVIKIVFFAYLFKLLYGLIAIFPTALLVVILKEIEGIDVYDYHTNFNPLRLDV